jgi:hypothetical protein
MAEACVISYNDLPLSTVESLEAGTQYLQPSHQPLLLEFNITRSLAVYRKRKKVCYFDDTFHRQQ